MDDAAFIEKFGNAETLARAVQARTGVRLTRSAIYEWKRKGIPGRWRKALADVAAEKGVPIPRGFQNAA